MGAKNMTLGSTRLRFEPGDAAPAKEYRIEDGNVEVRTIDPEGVSVQRAGNVWRRLTPEQLSIHVESNTVVAQWLERRLGWRPLLQACVAQEPNAWKASGSANHSAL
jgi:hypothetical protein